MLVPYASVATLLLAVTASVSANPNIVTYKGNGCRGPVQTNYGDEVGEGKCIETPAHPNSLRVNPIRAQQGSCYIRTHSYPECNGGYQEKQFRDDNDGELASTI